MTTTDSHPHPGRRVDAVLFDTKAGLLRLRRGLADVIDSKVRRRGPGAPAQAMRTLGVCLSEVVTQLYTDTDPNERALQLGKVQNLRIGARAMDGVRLGAGDVFSFWAQVGRPTRARGFVEGRELRQGCLIPTVAGGLCQLSNSLYRAAREAGCDILERHGHTAPIAGSPFPPGEDATVFWNYIDLRFRHTRAYRISAVMDTDSLTVEFQEAP